MSCAERLTASVLVSLLWLLENAHSLGVGLHSSQLEVTANQCRKAQGCVLEAAAHSSGQRENGGLRAHLHPCLFSALSIS